MYNTELRITHQLGKYLIDSIQIGDFETLEEAYNTARKRSSNVECNYTVYSNHTIFVNGKEVFEDCSGNIRIRE